MQSFRRQTRWWLFQDWNYYWEFLVCVCAFRVSKSWPYLRPKNAIFHTRFQIWPLRNYVIITSLITSIRTRTKRFLKIHFEFAHFSFFLIDFSGIETINTFTHFPVASTKTMKFNHSQQIKLYSNQYQLWIKSSFCQVIPVKIECLGSR